MWKLNNLKVGELTIRRYATFGLNSNMYIIIERGAALVIDPNTRKNALRYLRKQVCGDMTVLLTHEHYDHISGVNLLKSEFHAKVICSAQMVDAIANPSKNLAKYLDALVVNKSLLTKLYLSRADKSYRCSADIVFDESFDFEWQNHKISMIHAPGHSKGGAVIFFDSIAFTGDNLVNGNKTIVKLPGGSVKAFNAITKPLLDSLDNETLILPGHGRIEKLENIRSFAEI